MKIDFRASRACVIDKIWPGYYNWPLLSAGKQAGEVKDYYEK
jgi:hypothetical protein